MCVGGGVLTTGVAHGATNVLSDKVTFTAKLVPLAGGGFSIQNMNCSLTSDGEATPFACQISGTFVQSAGTGSISTNVTSGDGKTTSAASLTFSGGSFLGKGQGTEQDAPDPGQPPPPSYPCIAKYSGTVSSAMVMAGIIKVKESPTAP
jgi:hypothetical protein